MEIPKDIVAIIESLSCPVYKQHPKISYDENGDFHIECCCQQFKKQCMYLIKKLLMITSKGR
jgi:hypothetical protein